MFVLFKYKFSRMAENRHPRFYEMLVSQVVTSWEMEKVHICLIPVEARGERVEGSEEYVSL